ncbi:MAG TPA: hypothetical protein VNZ26_29865 [Vicinamibacterales bacterium]|nr:hypothetical protein [Vicinamibacterales bacterium]
MSWLWERVPTVPSELRVVGVLSGGQTELECAKLLLARPFAVVTAKRVPVRSTWWY